MNDNLNTHKNSIKDEKESLLDDEIILSPELMVDDIKAGDNFFIPTADLRNPCINRSLSTKESLLPESFWRSSLLIIEEIEKNSNDNQYLDGFIYPALYCFRQYLELTMKDSIRRYKICYCNANSEEAHFKQKHDLEYLFEELRTCTEVMNTFKKSTIKNVCCIIKEINEYDKNVDFRYPFRIEKESGKIKYNNISQLYDIENMKTMMCKLYMFFEEISNMVYLDFQYDYFDYQW